MLITYCFVAFVVGVFAAVNLVWSAGWIGLLAVPFIASAAVVMAAVVFASLNRVAAR